MTHSFLSTVKSLLKASHFGPTLLVVTISSALALTQFNLPGTFQIAVAIFAGQLTIGWSNDLVDFPLDKAAGRLNKPLVANELSSSLLKKLIPIALCSAVLFSFFSPLGLTGTLLHLLGIFSATLYNFKLKATILSPIPYLISFGTLPWAIFLPAGNNPPIWLFTSLAVFSLSFHFLNVLKDLEWDIRQGILGLPQVLGKKESISIAAGLAISGVLLLIYLA